MNETIFNKVNDHTIVVYDTYVHDLLNRFQSIDTVCKKEMEYRSHIITDELSKLKNTRMICRCDRILQLAHEIETYLFLSTISKTSLTDDRNSKSGPDMVFDTNIDIECVCPSPGNINISGLNRYILYDGTPINYYEKKQLMNERLSSSLCYKANLRNEYVNKYMLYATPFVIALSLGRLWTEYDPEDYGMGLTDILVGRGRPSLVYDKVHDIIAGNSYEHVDTFPKHNGASLNSVLFQAPPFKNVSGILFSCEVFKSYTTKNTFLFINPFTDKSLQLGSSLSDKIVYWTIEHEHLYRPFYKGICLDD